ncbi:GPP34 family phosphoprotein [Streptomyces sp. NPDC092952]|uniref:GOLPH3/VPS74 family protein n=1 Tax=Streptomyces sp. NPDC092952 TaxID=3366018 RepID=UPI00382A4511
MTQPAPELTLPEELLLLALHPLRGRPLCRARSLEYGTAGAALRELELQGRITEERGRVGVTGLPAPGDPFLGQVLDSLATPRAHGLGARGWVRQAGQYTGELCLEHLVRRSVLRRETGRLLGLLPFHRHLAEDPGLPLAVRDRFAAAQAAGFPEPRGRALAALVAAVGLASEVGRGGLRAGWTLHGLIDDDWAASAVHHNVRRDRSSPRVPSFASNNTSSDD